MLKLRFFVGFLSALVVAIACAMPLHAQIPILPNFNFPTQEAPQNSESSSAIVSGCVRLDGRCLIQIAAPTRSELASRLAVIEPRLEALSRTYYNLEDAQLQVYSRQTDSRLYNIFISVGQQEPVRLLSVTNLDARLKAIPIEQRATQVVERLEEGLEQAKQERQQDFLIQQAINAAIALAVMVVVSIAFYSWERRCQRSKQRLAAAESAPEQPLSSRLIRQQLFNFAEVQHRLFQLAQVVIWLGGSLYILWLFPYTRPLQVFILGALRIPFLVGAVFLAIYFAVRLSYALIDRFTAVLARNHLLTPEADMRLQLRVSTISGVTKGIATAAWIITGILVALAVIGFDIGPLLAGAGLIGVAVSFASQNLIRDALNGFFIILEDQYAIGDVISVGDVGGLVENMNLRITQVRDAEGRLITIPNSEIKIVANFSSNWSRADLKIPIAYQADTDRALQLIKQVTQDMYRDPGWFEQILEPPEVLGVDDFGNQGVVIRIWIKTIPLKQWEVSRESRRRIKVALDQAGIPLAVSRQELWINAPPETNGLIKPKNEG